MNDNAQGLYAKYNVTKADDGSVVDGCFVLRPDRDPHARVALQAYAESCQEENPALAADIFRWLIQITVSDPNYPPG